MEFLQRFKKHDEGGFLSTLEEEKPQDFSIAFEKYGEGGFLSTLDSKPTRLAKSFGGGAFNIVTDTASFLEAVRTDESEVGVGAEAPGILGSAARKTRVGIRKLGKMINEADTTKAIQDFLKVENQTIDEKIAGGFGSAATFLVPGLGVVKGAKLAGVAPKMAAMLGTSVSAVLESSVEAGSSYDTALKLGKTDDEAQDSAGKTFVANLPLNFVLDSWMFKGLKPGKALTKALKGAGQEATQEAVQEIIQSVSLEIDIDPKAVGESALIGGIVGGSVSGIQSGTQAIEELQQRRAQEKLNIQEQGQALGEVETPFQPPVKIAETESKTKEVQPFPNLEATPQEGPFGTSQSFVGTAIAQSPLGVDQALFSGAFEGTKHQTAETTTERVNKTKIIRDVQKAFGVEIRGKATNRWNKLKAGEYNTREQLVRLANWGELEPMVHEVAHHIENMRDFETGKPLKNRRKGGWLRSIAPIKSKENTELKNLDYDKKKKRDFEGFAEFMRHYLTTGEAQKRAPEFHSKFEAFLTTEPKLKGKLDNLRDQLDIWNKQGAINRIIQQTDYKGEHIKDKDPASILQKAKRKLTQHWYDSLEPFAFVEKELKAKTGKTLRPTESPFKMATYYKKKPGAIARTFVMKKAIDSYGNIVGDSLLDILKPIGQENMKKFFAYGMARRAKNNHIRGIESGLDIVDVDYTIKELQNPEWDAALDGITKWSGHLIDHLVKAGGFTQEQVDLMKVLNPVYIPLKRAFMEESEVDIKDRIGRTGGRGVKAQRGSARPIINPLDSLIQSATEIIAAAQKIHIANLVADLSANEGMGKFVTKVDPPTGAVTLTRKDFVKLLNDSKETAKIKPENKEKINASLDSLDNVLTVFNQKAAYKGNDNIVMVYRKGKPTFFQMDPSLYQSLQSISKTKQGPVLQVMSIFARTLRLGATGLNVGFGIATNPFRDALTQVAFSKREGPTPLDPLVGLYKEYKSEQGDLTWRFKATGGALSGMIGYDRASATIVGDEVLRSYLSKSGRTLHSIKNPIEGIKDLVNFSRDAVSIFELAPRVVELQGRSEDRFDQLKKENPDWSDDDIWVEAFNDAQDVTINFTKGGHIGEQINQVSAFFNVALQGGNKLYRAVKSNPVRVVTLGTAWMTIPALLLWWKNKDKEWYQNMEHSYRYSNFFWETEGGHVVRLSAPYDIGTLFIAAPIAGIEALYKKDPSAVSGLMKNIENQIPNPIPSMVGPAVQVMRNKDFLGNPIESRGSKYLPSTHRVRTNSYTVSKGLSKGFNKLGIELSPVQIDHLINGHTGGFFKQIPTKKIKRLEDVPVLKKLLLRTPDRPRRQLSEMFNEHERLSQSKRVKSASKDDLARLHKVSKVRKIILKKLKEVRNLEYDEAKVLHKEMGEVLKEAGY